MKISMLTLNDKTGTDSSFFKEKVSEDWFGDVEDKKKKIV